MKKTAIIFSVMLFSFTHSAQKIIAPDPADPIESATTFATTRTPQPLPDADYQAILQLIQNENFETGKLDLAKLFFGVPSQVISSAQVIGVLKLFALDDKKLIFAKFVYPSVLDKQNYYHLLEALSSPEAKKELSDYLENIKR